MTDKLGITRKGLEVALSIKEDYLKRQPICVPGDRSEILIPEYLLNRQLDLRGMDDPLALAMVATRDPEPPMALAAAARLTPLAGKQRLIGGVFGIVAETTRHPMVRKSIDLICDNAFSPAAIAQVRRHARYYVVKTRQQYTVALRHNLKALMDGSVAPRQFVSEFFELTEAGYLRTDIRKKLVLGLLLSETIRPSIKFLFLENFHRFPTPVRLAIVSSVLKAQPSRHVSLIKNELRWVISQGHAWTETQA